MSDEDGVSTALSRVGYRGVVGLPGSTRCAAKEIVMIWDTKFSMVNNVMLGLVSRLRELSPELKVRVHRELPNLEDAKRAFYDSHCVSHGASLSSSGVDELRWLKPVRPGDALSLRVTVAATKRPCSKPARGIVRSYIEVQNQNCEVVATVKAVNLLSCWQLSRRTLVIPLYQETTGCPRPR